MIDEDLSLDALVAHYDSREHPAQLVRRVHQRAAQLFTQAVVLPNLSATQFASVATLLKHGPLTLGQLGRLISMDPSTTTVVARKLEKQGLVTRRRSDVDQRATVLELTEHGQECARNHIPISVKAGKTLLAPLTDVEKKLFLKLMRKLLADDPE